MEENQQANVGTENGEGVQVMAADVYKDQMEKKLNSQYHKAVGTTTKRVTKTLLKFFHRDKRDMDCQTISFEEFEK